MIFVLKVLGVLFGVAVFFGLICAFLYAYAKGMSR